MLQDERAALEALMQNDKQLAEMAEDGLSLHRAVPPRPPQPKTLEFYSAASLYGAHLDRPPVIIDNLIPAGLTVLAGAPKRGKSWMALKMALCVSSGTPFFGLTAQKGSVLYLDLESKNYRVQERLSKLVAGPAPENLYFTHKSERLDGGLLEQLKGWAAQVEHPSMVIIDTLGRVKSAARKGENAYESDTRIFGELQSFALENKLAVVCVHHLKKDTGTGEDYFERVSGSMGITGACDAVMVLAGKRGEATSVLRTSSRDFESQDFAVQFNGGAWALVSCDSESYLAEQAYLKSPVVRGVLAMAAKYGQWQGTVTEMMMEASQVSDTPMPIMNSNVFSRELNQFLELLLKRNRVRISLRRTGRRRVISLETLGVSEQPTLLDGQDAGWTEAPPDNDMPW